MYIIILYSFFESPRSFTDKLVLNDFMTKNVIPANKNVFTRPPRTTIADDDDDCEFWFFIFFFYFPLFFSFTVLRVYSTNRPTGKYNLREITTRFFPHCCSTVVQQYSDRFEKIKNKRVFFCKILR